MHDINNMAVSHLKKASEFYSSLSSCGNFNFFSCWVRPRGMFCRSPWQQQKAPCGAEDWRTRFWCRCNTKAVSVIFTRAEQMTCHNILSRSKGAKWVFERRVTPLTITKEPRVHVPPDAKRHKSCLDPFQVDFVPGGFQNLTIMFLCQNLINHL